MMILKRTNSEDLNFQTLVKALDADLRIRDGDDAPFYAQYNKIDAIKFVVIAFDEETAVGCGAIKEYSPEIMEVKRMYVPPAFRGRGIAFAILRELEKWALELSYNKCILETGIKQPEAINLYTKCNYRRIPNYGQYENVRTSVCFEKKLLSSPEGI